MGIYKLLALGGALVPFAGAALAQQTTTVIEVTRYGTQARPFEGRRYETMRGLAQYLDVVASNAAAQAVGGADGSGKGRDFVKSVEEFSEKARDFHRRVDNYKQKPWEVPDEVDKLNKEAQEVSQRIRRAHVFESTWNDWDAVLDALNRMNRTIAGQDVEVPVRQD